MVASDDRRSATIAASSDRNIDLKCTNNLRQYDCQGEQTGLSHVSNGSLKFVVESLKFVLMCGEAIL
ncbi:hypothetical protein CsSME_00019945 [Camellia sinensis var. sinensis]